MSSGGKRKGAGRPSQGKTAASTSLTVRLDPVSREALERLRERHGGTHGGIIRRALVELLRRDATN